MKGFNTTLDSGQGSQSGQGGGSNDSQRADQVAIMTTYENLKTLRDNGELVPGTWYRITDYECTTTQDGTRSAGHQFDIIVLAIDGSHLSEDAYAAHHESSQDDDPGQVVDNDNQQEVNPGEGEEEGGGKKSRSVGYFANCKLEAWRLKYCLDNDRERFEWAADGTGGAYVTISGKEGTTRLMRTAILENDTVWQYGEEGNECYSAANPEAGDNLYSDQSLTNVINQCTDAGTIEPVFGKGVIWRMIDEFDNDLPYDFKNIQFKRFEITSVQNGHNENAYSNDGDHPVVGGWGLENPKVSVDTETAEWFYTFSSVNDGTVTDASMACDCDYWNDTGSGAGQNKMEGVLKGKFNLPNNVFVNAEGDLFCVGNRFGSVCFNNTFGDYCCYNTFGSFCFNNTFGNECSYNTFGNDNFQNTFGNDNYNNTFGNSFRFNTFGNSCGYNTFGNYCSRNTFGNNNFQNTFGNNNYNNTFGNGCCENTFGNNFGFNTFGNGCYGNTFGNDCSGNTFGNYCQNNTFGNGCYGNTFGNYCQQLTVFDGVQYCSVTGSNNGSAPVKNAQILNGTAGTSQSPLTIAFTANVSYTQCAAKNTNGTLKIWTPADLAN